MRLRIKHAKSLVHRHFKNGGGRVERAVDRPRSDGIPPAPGLKRAFAAAPGCGVPGPVQTVCGHCAAAQSCGQRRHR